MSCRCSALFVLAVGLASSLAASAALRDRDWDYPVRKKEEIRKTLKFADTARPGQLVVDNVFGSIKVEGYSGRDILLVARKTIYARTEDKAVRAQEEVKLDIAEKDRTVDVYVDGPFREHDRDGRERERHSWRDRGYEVQYDFEIKVPFKTDVAVSTVTSGDVEVRAVDGEFDVHNVNGKVSMSDVSGSGRAATANGRLTVGFRTPPAGACSFKTLNGDVVVLLPDGVSADFRLKTLRGEVYSDFPVSALAQRPAVREESKGKFIYKSDRFFGVRAGKGGPEIALDTMNGDILIKKRTA